MGATKRDISGVFDAELTGKRSRKAGVLDKVFDLSPKGITFSTDTFLPEWMEVGVEMRLPHSGTRRDQRLDIGCRGVVVQCARRGQGKGFEVVLMFLDLPKRAQAQLSVAPSAVAPFSISISR
ncbi:MAG: hypothetical protein ABSA12_08115 [Verrucomicrobiia bacterium]|jgi:hypothetical protein